MLSFFPDKKGRCSVASSNGMQRDIIYYNMSKAQENPPGGELRIHIQSRHIHADADTLITTTPLALASGVSRIRS